MISIKLKARIVANAGDYLIINNDEVTVRSGREIELALLKVLSQEMQAIDPQLKRADISSGDLHRLQILSRRSEVIDRRLILLELIRTHPGGKTSHYSARLKSMGIISVSTSPYTASQTVRRDADALEELGLIKILSKGGGTGKYVTFTPKGQGVVQNGKTPS